MNSSHRNLLRLFLEAQVVSSRQNSRSVPLGPSASDRYRRDLIGSPRRRGCGDDKGKLCE